jgi:hypothetical protein
LETFFPILEKYNLKLEAFSTSGNEGTLYRNIALRFSKSNMEYIDFYLDILTWRKSITINIEPGFLEDSAFLKSDCSLGEFKSELEKQWDVLIKFEEKTKNFRF